jgi:tetraacyldisaccharide 4'-kinase
MNAQVIIMDDGYQHWQLERDLDVVLVDTLNMFGNGCVLPRGTLREPLQNLARGDLFLLTKTDQSSRLNRIQLRHTIAQYNAAAPVVESIHHPKNFVEIADWYKGISENFKDLEELRGKDVMVFSAIGNPSSFEQTLSGIGLNILEAVRYPDHHDYGMLEMQYINERASSLKAVAIVATAKDAVKIPTEFIYSAREIPLYILNMDICITDGMDKFREYIDNAIAKKIPKAKITD